MKSTLNHILLKYLPIKVLTNYWLVKSSCLFKFVFLHEENMSHIQFPNVRFIAEFHWFSKKLFDLETKVNLDIRNLISNWSLTDKMKNLIFEGPMFPNSTNLLEILEEYCSPIHYASFATFLEQKLIDFSLHNQILNFFQKLIFESFSPYFS